MDQSLNPYRPPPTAVGEIDFDATTQVSFQLNEGLRRHAEAQYLLHWRPKLMLFSSLAMIAGSCAVLVVVTELMLAAFLPTLVGVLLISAGIYLSIVHQTKRRIRRRQQEYSLNGDELFTLDSDQDRTSLVTASETFAWPNHELRTYRTRRGLLICPEPLLYVLVPKQSSFQLGSYQQFVKLIESRAAARNDNGS